MPAPEIKITPGFPAIGKRTPVKIEIVEPQRGLSRVKVDFVQDQRVEGLAEKNYTPLPPLVFWGPRTQRDELTVEVGRDTIANLKAGQASVRVTAGRAGSWWRSPASRDPGSELAGAAHASSASGHFDPDLCRPGRMRSGGLSSGRVVRARRSSLRRALVSGLIRCPEEGSRIDSRSLPVPYDSNDSKVRLVADDGAGNEAEVAFIEKFFPRPFKTDTIQVTDEFMAKVVPEIMSHTTELATGGACSITIWR